MGVARVTVSVAPIGSSVRRWKGEFLVGSGASTTMVPAKVLRELGIEPFRKEPRELADGSVMSFDVGGAMITVLNETVASEVLFGPDDAEPLLGAITMQSANLIWDAQKEELRLNSRLKPLKRLKRLKSHRVSAMVGV
ncbi:MAG: hypothetical protein ACKVS9_17885 [Phycisphaerae bacterium]